MTRKEGGERADRRASASNKDTSAARRDMRTSLMAMIMDERKGAAIFGAVAAGAKRRVLVLRTTRAKEEVKGVFVRNTAALEVNARRGSLAGMKIGARRSGAEAREAGGDQSRNGDFPAATSKLMMITSSRASVRGDTRRKTLASGPSAVSVTWARTTNAAEFSRATARVAGRKAAIPASLTVRADTRAVVITSRAAASSGMDRSRLMDSRTRKWNARNAGAASRTTGADGGSGTARMKKGVRRITRNGVTGAKRSKEPVAESIAAPKDFPGHEGENHAANGNAASLPLSSMNANLAGRAPVRPRKWVDAGRKSCGSAASPSANGKNAGSVSRAVKCADRKESNAGAAEMNGGNMNSGSGSIGMSR